MPLHQPIQGHDTPQPTSLLQKSLGCIQHTHSNGRLGFSRQWSVYTTRIFSIIFISIFAGVAVAETFTGPEEFVEVIVVSFVDMVSIRFHILLDTKEGKDTQVSAPHQQNTTLQQDHQQLTEDTIL